MAVDVTDILVLCKAAKADQVGEGDSACECLTVWVWRVFVCGGCK